MKKSTFTVLTITVYNDLKVISKWIDMIDMQYLLLALANKPKRVKKG
ncbi:TPA: hypothetical protein ACGCKQ_002596 [Legionella pneumophila]|nr:hypothetical protein [Legionella pneumophila]HBA1635039.1 hypothetical protein [Legionella pneumophila]